MDINANVKVHSEVGVGVGPGLVQTICANDGD